MKTNKLPLEMKKHFITCIALISSFLSFSQVGTVIENEVSINKFIDGTLTTPINIEHPDLVILIQGSGPIDRNGNGFMMKNNGSKLIAKELAENEIASFRFDKRIFKMDKFRIREEDLSFEDFVTDVNDI